MKLNNRLYEVAGQVMHLNDKINNATLQTHKNMMVLDSRLQNITFYIKHTFSQIKINLHR